MQAINYFLTAIVLSVSSIPYAAADCEHGAVHIHLSDGQEEVDCGQAPMFVPVDRPAHPWYLHEHFDYYTEDEDPNDELTDETSWPSQREDFSDYLFRYPS